MDSFNPSLDLPAFLFVNGGFVEKAEGAVQRSFAEVIWQDDSAQLVLMAKGSDGGDQETLDPGTAARLLQLACRLDAVGCARVLVEGKVGTAVHINEMDEAGRTPLHVAAEMHSTKCIELLIEKNARTDLKSKDGNGLLALEIALSSKRMQVHWSHKDSVEELLVLLQERDLSAIRLLAASTKDIGEISYIKAMNGQIAELAALLLVDADKVTAPVVVRGPTGSKNNKTTVYQAVLGETLLLWEIEKTAAGDPEAIGWESIENCCVKRRILLREIELLQLFGVRVVRNDSKDKKDLSLLLRASKAGDESVVKLLLKAHVDVNEKDADGNSALHWCLRAGGTSQDPRLTWLLIKHGAKVSQRNRLGLTPFHLAAAKGNYQALQILLLQAPECVDLASETKETPLFFAVKNNFLDCAKLLLRYGASTQALSLRKERPVDLAKSQEMRFILSPANLRFLNCISPPQEGEAFMFAKVDSNEVAYEQILAMRDIPANAERRLDSSHPAFCRYCESSSGCARASKCHHGHHPLQKAVCDRKIFVGGLPPSVDSGDLKEYFQANFGPVEEAMIASTPSDGHVYSRGFGFVTFKREETAANAVEKHFVKIFGKRVEIKNAVIKSGPAKPASRSTSLKQFIPKDLTFKKLEPGFREVKFTPYNPKTDLSDKQIVKSECDCPVAGPLTEKSLPPWVSKFQKWLPIYLKETYKRLGPGEHYPLSSIKADFRARCGYELDHASLGFLKLSDFIRSLTGICRMKIVPVGNGPTTHIVLLPLQSTVYQELFQSQHKQSEQQQLMQSIAISKHNVEDWPSKKCDIGCLGSGSSNPSPGDVIDSINQRLRSTFRTDTKDPMGRLDEEESTLPTMDAGRMNGVVEQTSFSVFKNQWDHYVLDHGLCIFCCSRQGWLAIVPCLHKICNFCKVNSCPNKCVICNSVVRDFRLCTLESTYSSTTIMSDSDFKSPGTVQKPSLCNQKSMSVQAVPSTEDAVCLIKYFCQGARATVVCVPCGHRVACHSCIPPFEASKLKQCLICGHMVTQVQYFER